MLRLGAKMGVEKGEGFARKWVQIYNFFSKVPQGVPGATPELKRMLKGSTRVPMFSDTILDTTVPEVHAQIILKFMIRW